jgi:hypothetical protein
MALNSAAYWRLGYPLDVNFSQGMTSMLKRDLFGRLIEPQYCDMRRLVLARIVAMDFQRQRKESSPTEVFLDYSSTIGNGGKHAIEVQRTDNSHGKDLGKISSRWNVG